MITWVLLATRKTLTLPLGVTDGNAAKYRVSRSKYTDVPFNIFYTKHQICKNEVSFDCQ